MLLRASGICQTNLTSWLERLRQLSFQEINLEKMIFIFKKMSQTLHQARSTHTHKKAFQFYEISFVSILTVNLPIILLLLSTYSADVLSFTK